MDKKIKILHIEDLNSDVLLIDRALKKGKLDFEKLVVDTKAKFAEGLKEFSPDIILSDHSLPSFTSHDALDILRDTGLKIPFILITGNISEEFAVDVIKRGADDYVLKDRLKRLPTAIHNSLKKFRLEKERKCFIDEIIRNEKHCRALIENINDAIILADENSLLVYQSPSVKHITGFAFEELKGKPVFEFVHPDDKKDCLALFQQASEHPCLSLPNQYRVLHKDGHCIWTEGTIINLLHDESVKAFIVSYRDTTKRKQVEDALRQSEFRYRQIVETAQEGIWLIDEDNRTTFVNQKMCDILEYPKEEIMGRENFDFLDEAGKLEVSKSLERRRKGITGNVDLRYITKSGKHIWTSISGNPVFDEAGNYKGALAMVSDITEKKNLEDLLDKVNKLAGIGNWEIDVQKNTLNWSAITKQIHEVAIDFLPDLNSAITFYKAGSSRNSITHVLQEAREKGIPWDLEVQLVTAKSNEIWVRAIGQAEFMDGKCVRLYGSFQDIDARKKAESEILKAYEEKNIILESIGDAFFALDKNWIVTYWNKEAEKLLECPRNKIIGHDLWEVFSNSLDSESYKQYHHSKESKEIVHFEDYYAPLNRWYEISAYPSSNGLAVYFRDVTERKLTWIHLNELNDTLQKNARDLVISNAELEQFAYVASHDLQEPLRMVTSFLTQIEKKYEPLLDDKGKQYIHFAVDGAKRMRQIILDLLEFSRVGRLDDDLEKVELTGLIEEIILLYRNQIEENNANITFNSLPSIYTYKTPLRQVFQNLLGNALKYQKEGTEPRITISCTEHENYWQFAVKDNGIGITAGYFEKIFIIFQRLHSKEEYSGTGMGLAICKKIVENMGGKIWVESEENNGCTFFFTLPKQYKHEIPERSLLAAPGNEKTGMSYGILKIKSTRKSPL